MMTRRHAERSSSQKTLAKTMSKPRSRLETDLLVHTPRRKKGGWKKKKAMGNVESCLKEEEEAKPGLLESEPTPPASSPSRTFRRTWHGHNRQSDPNLRQGTWHGLPGFRKRSQHGISAEEEQDTAATTDHATATPASPRRHTLPRRVRKGSIKAVHKVEHAVGHFIHAFQEFLFPRSPLHEELHKQSMQTAPNVRGGVLLYGCSTPDEHYQRIQKVLELVKNLHGEEGLVAVGLEYRLVLCEQHRPVEEEEDSDEDEETAQGEGVVFPGFGKVTPSTSRTDLVSSDDITSSLRSTDMNLASSVRSLDGSFYEPGHVPDSLPVADDFVTNDVSRCHSCMRRLFHIESGTMIDESNRKEFVADGDMYEAVARLVQETAQNIMMEEAGLEWVTIEDCTEERREPVRALMSSSHPYLQRRRQDTLLHHVQEKIKRVPLLHRFDGEEDDDEFYHASTQDRPTLIICTGRGKVRTGIFSRHHLMCTGLEAATAVPIVREAAWRRMNIFVVDPNVHGEGLGFVTFEKNMDWLQELFYGDDDGSDDSLPSSHCRDLFVLSHSASGGHMARYLLGKSDSDIFKSIRAVAFTDSTHSIQWANNDKNRAIFDFLQSQECVYFRCANTQRDVGTTSGKNQLWHIHAAGEECRTDSFWQRRFGTILTLWAGTTEHSLTNWYAHTKIWEHFDHFLRLHYGDKKSNIGSEADKHKLEDALLPLVSG